MFFKAILGIVVLAFALVQANSRPVCIQRSFPDFRPHATNCSAFWVCTFGQLVLLSCSPGSVFDENSHSCVPAFSNYDTCTNRMAAQQRCPRGTRGVVPHPTNCAQYYECGASNSWNRRGWERELRECPFPYVFSTTEKSCVRSSPGICGTRQEPLDQCDYKENQCEGHIDCVPCNVRFPTCRGRQDGRNAWSGREGSPYFITCRRQRVVSTSMCLQEGGVFLFDVEKGECVRQDPEEMTVPDFINHNVPHTLPNNFFPQNMGQQTSSFRPSFLANLPNQNPNPYNPGRNQYQQNSNQYQFR